MDFKYIMFDNGVTLIPVIFSGVISHITMAQLITSEPHFRTWRPFSAGFIQFEPLKCFGYSTSLEMPCNSGDADVIRKYPYLHGLKYT